MKLMRVIVMNSIPDYSKVGNFNLAAIEAVADNYKIEDVKDNIVSVAYKYKGSVLMATAEISLDGEQVRYVGIINIEPIKG